MIRSQKLQQLPVFVLLILGVQFASPKPGCAASECRYDPDQPLPQLGPGKHQDQDYKFFYVSDYESSAQMFRRQICNQSGRIVRFECLSQI